MSEKFSENNSIAFHITSHVSPDKPMEVVSINYLPDTKMIEFKTFLRSITFSDGKCNIVDKCTSEEAITLQEVLNIFEECKANENKYLILLPKDEVFNVYRKLSHIKYKKYF